MWTCDCNRVAQGVLHLLGGLVTTSRTRHANTCRGANDVCGQGMTNGGYAQCASHTALVTCCAALGVNFLHLQGTVHADTVSHVARSSVHGAQLCREDIKDGKQ